MTWGAHPPPNHGNSEGEAREIDKTHERGWFYHGARW